MRRGFLNAPRRTRTYNPLIKSQKQDRRNPRSCKGNGDEEHTVSLPLPYGPPALTPDLAFVVDAWPALTEPVKAAVLILIRAADPGGGGSR